MLSLISDRSLNEPQLILQCCFALLTLSELVDSGLRWKWVKNMATVAVLPYRFLKPIKMLGAWF